MGVSVTTSKIWTQFVATKSPALRDELITTYAPLARFVVGRLGIPPTSLLDAEDLISYGMIGLINAVDRFDPSRGVRFEAYATSRIRGAVIDQLRALNWLPRSAMSRLRQIEGALANLEQRFHRPAKEEEAAAEIGVSVIRYRQMLLEASATMLSLDAPLNPLAHDDEATSLGDILEDQHTQGPAEQVERYELTALLTMAIDSLPKREKLLLSLYYQEELTMKVISKIMSISESRVCQLHMQAIMRLRGALHMHQSEETKSANNPSVLSDSSRGTSSSHAVDKGKSRRLRQMAS